MLPKKIFDRLKVEYFNTTNFCEVFEFGKSNISIIQKGGSKSEEMVLDDVHTKCFGPLKVTSKGGVRYFIKFIDDYSNYTVLYPMKNKFESFKYLTLFKKSSEK